MIQLIWSLYTVVFLVTKVIAFPGMRMESPHTMFGAHLGSRQALRERSQLGKRVFDSVIHENTQKSIEDHYNYLFARYPDATPIPADAELPAPLPEHEIRKRMEDWGIAMPDNMHVDKAALLGVHPDPKVNRRFKRTFKRDVISVLSSAVSNVFSYIIPGTSLNVHKDPVDGEIRGPCPGINAAANRGYLSRDGHSDGISLIVGLLASHNLGPDFGAVIAVIAVAIQGYLYDSSTNNILAVDIGSTNPSGTLASSSLAKHNTLEGDTSMLSDDYFFSRIPFDDYTPNPSYAKELFYYCSGRSTDLSQFDYTSQCIADHRANRFRHSKLYNPQFFNGPALVGIYVAAVFSDQLFGGFSGKWHDVHSMCEHFGLRNCTNDMNTWTLPGNGYNKIPENFVKRLVPYTLAEGVARAAITFIQAPVSPGFNLGPNNFLGINVGDLVTNGTVNLSILDPQLVTCLLTQIILGVIPPLIKIGDTDLSYLASVALNSLPNNCSSITVTISNSSSYPIYAESS